MTGLVQGRVALVTGAGSGIGRESALLFAREGASVIVSDVDEAAARATVALVDGDVGGARAIAVACDVSDPDDVAALVSAGVDAFGAIHCAHNNAGIRHTSARLAEVSEKEYERVLDVNLKGIWLCMRLEIEHMLETGGGSVVNTASLAGIRGSVSNGVYAAAKHGVVGLTRSAAVAYASDKIRVNCVCPGLTRTAMVTDQFEPDELDVMAQMQVNGRIGEPAEVAEAVVWLCSDRASFVSGVALPVDAGWSVQ